MCTEGKRYSKGVKKKNSLPPRAKGGNEDNKHHRGNKETQGFPRSKKGVDKGNTNSMVWKRAQKVRL